MTTQDIEEAYRTVASETYLETFELIVEPDAVVKLRGREDGSPGAYVQAWIPVEADGAAKALAQEWINACELRGNSAQAWFDLDDRCIRVEFLDDDGFAGNEEWPEPPLGLDPKDLLSVFCEVWNSKYRDNPFSRQNFFLSFPRVVSPSDLG